jgi:hypothetical protein
VFATYVGTGITAVEGTYRDVTLDSTFENVDIGAAETDRRIVVVVTWKGNQSRTVSSITVDGNSATIHINKANSGGVYPGVAIGSYVSSSLSGTVSFYTFYSGSLGLNAASSMMVYTLSACDVGDSNDARTADAVTTTVNASYGSFIISGGMAYNLTGSVLWTGATEGNETSIDGSSFKSISAYKVMTASDETYDTTATASTSATHMRIASVVFTP